MTSIDEPPFYYSLLRISGESDFAQEFKLGRDNLAVITLIRAAIESRHVLSAWMFAHPFERLLIDFLCGDPVYTNAYELINRHHKASMWLVRHRSHQRSKNYETAKMPLIGLTQECFRALVYLARLRLAQHDSGATDYLLGAIEFSLGRPLDQIEAELIPF